jgi:hypothetical protein
MSFEEGLFSRFFKSRKSPEVSLASSYQAIHDHIINIEPNQPVYIPDEFIGDDPMAASRILKMEEEAGIVAHNKDDKGQDAIGYHRTDISKTLAQIQKEQKAKSPKSK